MLISTSAAPHSWIGQCLSNYVPANHGFPPLCYFPLPFLFPSHSQGEIQPCNIDSIFSLILGIKVIGDQAKSETDILLNSVYWMVCMLYSCPRLGAHGLHSIERPSWEDNSGDLEAVRLAGNSCWQRDMIDNSTDCSFRNVLQMVIWHAVVHWE